METYRDYTLIFSYSPVETSQQVYNYMQKGWVPLGGVALATLVVNGETRITCMQAMVLPEL